MKIQTGIKLGTLVFLILFTLKMIGQTDMHWFWVLTSWAWMPVLILLSSMVLVFCFGVLIVIIALILGE